jgi:AraC-like DNA-binding protein
VLAIHALFYREAPRAWSVGSHHHRVHQWYCCIHGTLRLELAGRPLELGPEQSVVVRPLVPRRLEAPGRAPGYLVAVFDGAGLELDRYAHRALILPATLREDLLELVRDLRGGARADSDLLREALLTRLLLGLVRANRDRPPASLSALNASVHRDAAERADAVLAAECHRPLTRREVARAVSISEPHLARLFKAATGRTLGQRLTEHRVARAKALLLETARSVTDIAGEVGYASFSHFALVFRRAVGVTPSDYRRSGGGAWR